MGKIKDLTGQKFGNWTILERAPNDKNGGAMWLCECNCKNKTRRIVSGHSLRLGLSNSCGCNRIESCSKAITKLNKETKKKYNNYNLSNEYGIGYTSKGEEFWFDLEDYDLIKNYCWYIDNNGYVSTNDFNNNYKTIKLHKLLFPNSKVIDHINHRKFDNRKHNLRECTYSNNNMNRGLHSNNTSGVTGVSWNKNIEKWCATIRINGKQKHLGSFKNFEDAVKIRKEAEEKYYREYSYSNSIKMEENKNGKKSD